MNIVLFVLVIISVGITFGCLIQDNNDKEE